jgi:hypothetical protein
LTAETWTALGEVENANSVTSSITHLFVAHALTYGPANPEANEADLQLVWLPYSDAVEAALNGEIRESASVALLLTTEVRRTRGVWTWLT